MEEFMTSTYFLGWTLESIYWATFHVILYAGLGSVVLQFLVRFCRFTRAFVVDEGYDNFSNALWDSYRDDLCFPPKVLFSNNILPIILDFVIWSAYFFLVALSWPVSFILLLYIHLVIYFRNRQRMHREAAGRIIENA